MGVPYVRDFADPLEGLTWQLDELLGFARTVPPLIDADRQATWDRLGEEPGGPEEELVDVYARESGPGTGGGFADFGRTVLVASVALGWEAFTDFLALHLAGLKSNRRGRSGAVRDEGERKMTSLTLARLVGQYAGSGIDLRALSGWDDVREIQFTRNALVHNHGRYTPDYFDEVASPRLPDPQDPYRFASSNDRVWLVDREDMPLTLDYVASSLDALGRFAKTVGNIAEGPPSA